jgi:PAS domain S-box-containing protein
MFIEPSENARIKETVYKKLNGLTFELQEYIARRKDGSTFPTEAHSSPIYRNEKLNGFRGVIIDITAR